MFCALYSVVSIMQSPVERHSRFNVSLQSRQYPIDKTLFILIQPVTAPGLNEWSGGGATGRQRNVLEGKIVLVLSVTFSS